MELFEQQKGAALVGVLLVLLVLTLLGTHAFLNSITETAISSNYYQGLRASYSAEAGVHYLLSRFRQHPEFFLEKKSGPEMDFPVYNHTLPAETAAGFGLQLLRYDPQTPPAYTEVVMVGSDKEKRGISRVRASISCVPIGGTYPAPLVFTKGMVTAGRLVLNDPLDIRGDLHASRGHEISPSSLIEQLRRSQFSVTQSSDPLGPDFQGSLTVPALSEKSFQEYLAVANQTGNLIFNGSQTLTLEGDQKGKMYFIDGDLHLKAEALSGATIVVRGRMTVEGSSIQLPGQELNTAYIAGGDIQINSPLELSGIFWANGGLRKNGPGKIRGAVVCQGDIFLSPGLQFERISPISNFFLSPLTPTYSFFINGKSQM
ncbi:MAG: PilX N-terminal domain-containing pilus assembly protein [Thermodesulfobacteriota bacterium]